MDPESRKLLEETRELVEENNRILQSIRRHMRISRVMSIFYWVFILGSAIGAYYFVQPYLDQLTSIYGGTKSNIDSFNEVFKNFNN